MYKNIYKIIKIIKKTVVTVVIFVMIFPYTFLTALADPVPVKDELVNGSIVSQTIGITRLLGEIMAPIYHLATPGSYLTKDIYRYLMKHTEDEFGIDKDFFRRMQRKADAPTVDIVFAPTNPKVGEKITAFAIPKGFKNSKDKLYYTWYIVHEGDKNVDNGKREAMKIVAAGNYDKKLFGEPVGNDGDRDAYNVSFGGDNGIGGKGAEKAVSGKKDDCTDCECLKDITIFGEKGNGCFDDRGELLYSSKDEYKEAQKDRGDESAKNGRGVVNSEFLTRCYRHNFGSQGEQDGVDNLAGRDLIIKCQHAFGDKVGESNKKFGIEEENNWGTNIENPDTDGDGVIDEADVAGLGQDEFTWIYRKGDRVSVSVEGMSNIVTNEGTTVRLRYKNKNWEKDDVDVGGGGGGNKSDMGGCTPTGINMTVSDTNVGEPALHFEQSLVPDTVYAGKIWLRYLGTDGNQHTRRSEHLIGKKEQVVRGVIYALELDTPPVGWEKVYCERQDKTFYFPHSGANIEFQVCTDDGQGTVFAPYTVKTDLAAKAKADCNGDSSSEDGGTETDEEVARRMDTSPKEAVEDWYKDEREKCERSKNSCIEDSSSSSACIKMYSDCMKRLWEHKLEDENDEDAFGNMTGYHKIMWAAPGICSKTKKKDEENDWCDTDDDIGFQYLKLYDPGEQGKKLMEVSINVSPKNPQFSEPDKEDLSTLHSDSTDFIVANANVISKDNINPDYLYYKWNIWRCDQNNFDKCEDITKNIDLRSRQEGMGVRDIGFYPKKEVFKNKKALLKITVIVKKHKNASMSSPGINGEYTQQVFPKKKNETNKETLTQKYAYTASKLLEVVKHNMKIKLYQARVNADGKWVKDKEICNIDKYYKKVCPVYPYQVLMAEVSGGGEAVSWKLNGRNIGPTLNKLNNQNPNSKTIFFPILGAENSLGKITVTSEIEGEGDLWEDNNVIEERIYSVHSPMAKIIDLSGKLRKERIQKAFTGALKMKGLGSLWWMLTDENYGLFEQEKSTVNIPVTIIPKYLQDEINGATLRMQGYVDNKFKGSVQSEDEGDRWVFNNIIFENNKPGKISQFKIRTIREFTEDYKVALKKSFDINPLDEVVNDQIIKVKAITIDDYNKIAESTQKITLNTKQKLNKLFASTIKNAPAYLIFMFRLAISFVLVGMISFGLIFKTKNNN